MSIVAWEHDFDQAAMPKQVVRRVVKAGYGKAVSLTKWLDKLNATMVRVEEVSTDDTSFVVRITKVH